MLGLPGPISDCVGNGDVDEAFERNVMPVEADTPANGDVDRVPGLLALLCRPSLRVTLALVAILHRRLH